MFGPNWVDRSSCLGVTVTLLTLLGLARRASRDRSRPWAVLGLLFALLAFGPQLQVARHKVMPMPYALLWRALPPLRIGGVPGRMSYMTTFCLAIVVCLALASLRGSRRRRLIVYAASCVLVLAEYLCIPAPSLTADAPTFYRRMADDTEDCIVVDSAYCQNMYFQTVHGKKMMGGYVSRSETRALEFIGSNPITAELLGFPWLRRGDLQATQDDVLALREHKVRYIIDHHGQYRGSLKDELGLTPIHQSPEIDVYDIRRR